MRRLPLRGGGAVSRRPPPLMLLVSMKVGRLSSRVSDS
jgi:hypothetical protein